ncbi:MAG: hypothetical protein ACLQBY_12385 [Solirubrobacteraceae bacterium]
MTAVSMKREYGPTLGQLLAPRWHAASRLWRAAAIAAAVGLVAALVAVGLTLENASFSHGGSVPFSFSYRDLYSVAPDPGGYVKVQSRWPDGALKYSYAVAPLRLPAYSGELSGEMPLFAVGFIRTLGARYRSFELRGEGKTRISNTLGGYQVLFTADVEGRRMFGRDVLLLPERAGVREGVAVTMLTSPTATAQVLSPMEVGETGVLLRPLKTFAFG